MSKKSFVLHNDSLDVLREMSDEEAGKLFKAIYFYQIKEDYKMDTLTKITMVPFKNQFDRDELSYQKICERNRNNGDKGGRPKETQQNPNKPKETHSVILGSDSDSDSKKDSKKENNIEERKLKFASTLEPFLKTYGREMLGSFYKYWTEPNKSNTKFKQENEKTWSLSLRLETWASNESKFGNKTNKSETTLTGPIPQDL